jgi:two-component system, LuxR family, sensor kinase FixL
VKGAGVFGAFVQSLTGSEQAAAGRTGSLTDRAAPSSGSSPIFGANPWIAGAIYVVVYSAINAFTRSSQFAQSGITLWSPDDGLTALMLLRSRRFALLALATQIATDVFVNRVAQGLVADVVVSAISIAIFAIMAEYLSRPRWSRFGAQEVAQVVSLLAIVPLAAAACAATISVTLFMAGAISLHEIWPAARVYWIGDTVGIIVVVSGVRAALEVAREPARVAPSGFDFVASVFVAVAIFLIAALVVPTADSRTMLYLMLLPVLWIGVTYGYRPAAMAVLFGQISLVASVRWFGVDDGAFGQIQLFMLVLSVAGLLLGGISTERTSAALLLQRQRRALERGSAQASLGAAAASIAHELSQPLTSLAAYVHAARRLLRQGSNAETIEHALASAESEAKRAQAIMARVRDFFAGGGLRREDVDLAELAQKICALNLSEAARRGVDISVVVPSTGNLNTVECDRVMVEQALNNLVVNAVDAISSAGAKHGAVVIELASEAEQAGFDVVDDGPGVDPTISDRLFEAFESTKPTGMGMGLSLTQQIMQKHGGRLEWRPSPPSGARFSIRFPRLA